MEIISPFYLSIYSIYSSISSISSNFSTVRNHVFRHNRSLEAIRLASSQSAP